MQITLDEVVKAIDDTDIDTRYCYYIPEERIILQDDELDQRDLIPLPSHKEINDYQTMLDFIELKTDGEAKEWLSECVKGAGAFRRFRNTLQRFALTDSWLDFLEDAHEDIAIEWCEYYGIEYIESGRYDLSLEKPEPKPRPSGDVHHYRLIDINKDNIYSLVYLVSEFRKYLHSLKDIKSDFDVDDALAELQDYVRHGYPIFAVADNGRFIGYGVCRVEDSVVWLESIYVKKEYRRKGIGRILFNKAETIAKEYGNDTLYQYVHPNNHLMIDFLAHNGYDVLNLIEIRKGYANERFREDLQVGEHKYRY